jgi:DNA-binding MarR family transcriptional regulator
LRETDINAARRLLSLLGSEDDSQTLRNSPGERLQRARRDLDIRYRRLELFGDQFGAEPPFAILLALYTVDSHEEPVTIGRITELASLSHSTAVRWIEMLLHDGWITRRPHPDDGRKALLTLPPKAREAIDELYAED